MPRQPGQQIGHIGLNHDALVFTSQASRQASGYFRIVKRIFADAVLVRKRDGVSAHRLLAGLRHHGHDAGRVQTGAEKGADGNVADHLAFHRTPEALANFFRQFVL